MHSHYINTYVLYVYMCLHTYITPRSRALPEKLPVNELVKKFPAFYKIHRIITVFTKARHTFLS